MFQPNDELEKSLRRDVETAQRNLQNYMERKEMYVRMQPKKLEALDEQALRGKSAEVGTDDGTEGSSST